MSTSRPPLTWAYGVTTVSSRKDNLLPQTLNSLCDAGFGDPRLFVDGCDDPHEYAMFGRPVTCRPNPPLKIVGNWMLGMWELYVRNPQADRYAMFQDDVLCVANLREYLEDSPYPKKGYLNLLTHKENEQWTHGKPGWCEALQRGLGAVGLVFNRDAIQEVLCSGHLVRKPVASGHHKIRAWKKLDGGVLEAMRTVGYKEYIHNPSLIQHCGLESTLGNTGGRYTTTIQSFPGNTVRVGATVEDI